MAPPDDDGIRRIAALLLPKIADFYSEQRGLAGLLGMPSALDQSAAAQQKSREALRGGDVTGAFEAVGNDPVLNAVGVGNIKYIPPAVSTVAMRQLAHLISRTSMSNPKIIRKFARAQGNADQEAAQIPEIVDGIRQIQRARGAAELGEEPLIEALRRRRWIARGNAARKPFLDAPIAGEWQSANRDRVIAAAPVDRLDAVDEARRATLETVTRAARKRGWQVGHTSVDRAGRASSRYIDVPDVGRVRLSDHDLPMTMEREYRQGIGGGPSWAGEIIVDESNWSKPLDWWMKALQSGGIQE